MSLETTDSSKSSSDQASPFNIFLKMYGIREKKPVDGPLPEKNLRLKALSIWKYEYVT